MLKKICLATALLGTSAHAADINHPVVLELFTSQGCSSCPPADALLKELSADPDILPLSFHVHYWNYLGWKDPYSSPAYTDRQKTYERSLHENNMFTPQLIVNGTKSLVGSQGDTVRQVIAAAKQTPLTVSISLAPTQTGHQLVASIAAITPSLAPAQADIWEVQFDRYGKTSVSAGENNGRTLESINTVTSITSLGTWLSNGSKAIAIDMPSGDGVAIIVQTPQQGAILSAAAYIK